MPVLQHASRSFYLVKTMLAAWGILLGRNSATTCATRHSVAEPHQKGKLTCYIASRVCYLPAPGCQACQAFAARLQHLLLPDFKVKRGLNCHEAEASAFSLCTVLV